MTNKPKGKNGKKEPGKTLKEVFDKEDRRAASSDDSCDCQCHGSCSWFDKLRHRVEKESRPPILEEMLYVSGEADAAGTKLLRWQRGNPGSPGCMQQEMRLPAEMADRIVQWRTDAAKLALGTAGNVLVIESATVMDSSVTRSMDVVYLDIRGHCAPSEKCETGLRVQFTADPHTGADYVRKHFGIDLTVFSDKTGDRAKTYSAEF